VTGIHLNRRSEAPEFGVIERWNGLRSAAL
jgi:hypothetical protein